MRPTYAYESLYCLLRRWKDKAGRSEKYPHIFFGPYETTEWFSLGLDSTRSLESPLLITLAMKCLGKKFAFNLLRNLAIPIAVSKRSL